MRRAPITVALATVVVAAVGGAAHAEQFTSLDYGVIDGTDGATAFRGFIGTSGTGIWSDASGALDLVARTGNPAPGTGSGVTFSGFAGPAINASGRTASWAVVAGALVDGSNDTGIWAVAPNGALTLVAREGSAIEVAPGDVRTISGLSLITGNRENGGATGFNDAGRLALQVAFTDGSSGVVVTSMCPPADLDGDCAVGFGDVLVVIGAWGACPSACPADLNGDGVVNFADILQVIANWG